MILQRLCQAALLLSFAAACLVVAAPAWPSLVLTAGQAATLGLVTGYAVSALAFLAAPRLRRADLSRAALVLLASLALFRFGLTPTSLMLCLSTAFGALAIVAPARIDTFRRRTRARLGLRASPAAPERRQAASLRAMALQTSPASKI